jgi:hypothetical protein
VGGVGEQGSWGAGGRESYSIELTKSLIMRRVCSRPQVHWVIGQSTLLWPERTVCATGDTPYRERCITAQRHSLWGLASVAWPIMHPTPVADLGKVHSLNSVAFGVMVHNFWDGVAGHG